MQNKPSGNACFEVLGCSVAEPEQLLVVIDSVSATRNLHDDNQCKDNVFSMSLAADFFPLVNDPYIF